MNKRFSKSLNGKVNVQFTVKECVGLASFMLTIMEQVGPNGSTPHKEQHAEAQTYFKRLHEATKKH